MASEHYLTPINLALDGTLDQFLELYESTSNVYCQIAREHPELSLENDTDIARWDEQAVPLILPYFESIAAQQLSMFVSRLETIRLKSQHFKRFMFLNPYLVEKKAIEKRLVEEVPRDPHGLTNKNHLEEENRVELVHKTRMGLIGFLRGFQSVITRAICDEVQNVDASYTIFQAVKDVNNRLKDRMELRRLECRIPNNEQCLPTDAPLFLYDALNRIGCKVNQHEIVPEKYYVRHNDGMTTIVLPVHYCKDCDRYLCGRISYSLFMDYFKGMHLEIRDAIPGGDGNWKFRTESKLHRLGYNVVEGSLKPVERKELLVSIMESKAISYFEIVATIEQNIHTFGTNPRMQNAVEKWRDDLFFLHKYMLHRASK